MFSHAPVFERFELHRNTEHVNHSQPISDPTNSFPKYSTASLEEIAMEGKEQFIEAGGEDYIHIPCLNDSDPWVALMAEWINNWHKSETLPV